SKLFWVVNSLELFERGAYYGILGYFSYHLAYNLMFSTTIIGTISMVLFLLNGFVPLFAASVGRKVGYKKVLIFAFILLIFSYCTMFFLENEIPFLFITFAWGLGAGSFKPVISASIAYTTTPEQRNSAYSIFYWSINLGSFFFPLLIGLFVPEAMAEFAFLVGMVLIGVNLTITMLLYKNPIDVQSDLKIKDAFLDMVKVLMEDKRFTILLLIYVGYFFMYSMNHTYLPLYMKDFKIMPSFVTAPLLAVINPLTIIIVGPLLAGVADKRESLPMMITGLSIFSMGVLLMGFIPKWYMLAGGIIIYSIGELMVGPNFSSYVSKIAPADKVAIYMGYSFIPAAIGNSLGSLLGGVAYATFAEKMERPALFWAVYVGLGLFTIANFLLYNRINSREPPEKRKGVIWNKLTPIIAWTLIPIVIIAGFSLGTTKFQRTAASPVENTGLEGLVNLTWKGAIVSSEMVEETNSIDIEWEMNSSYEYAYQIVFTLSWKDEDDMYPPGLGVLRRCTNQPDTFVLQITAPNGKNQTSPAISNTHGSPGNISLKFNFTDEELRSKPALGNWSITITCTEAGDQYFPLAPLVYVDSGNEVNLDVEVEYKGKQPETS
ncbi:MAG: MFS transporter, partial [Thermoplasmata archaeon]